MNDKTIFSVNLKFSIEGDFASEHARAIDYAVKEGIDIAQREGYLTPDTSPDTVVTLEHYRSYRDPNTVMLHSNTDMMKPLLSIVEDAQRTGGLLRFSDGLYAPAADPTWVDLGQTIFDTFTMLQNHDIDVTLDILNTDSTSRDYKG